MINYYRRTVTMELVVKVSADNEKNCKKVAESCFRQALQRTQEPEYLYIDGHDIDEVCPIGKQYTIWRDE